MTERELKQALDGISLRAEWKDELRKKVVAAQRQPVKRTQKIKPPPRRTIAIAASLVVILGLGGIWGLRELDQSMSKSTDAPAVDVKNDEMVGYGGDTGAALGGADEAGAATTEEIEEAPPADGALKDGAANEAAQAPQIEGAVSVYGAVHELSADKLTLMLHDGQTLTLTLSDEWQQTLSQEELASGVLAEVQYDPETMELLALIRQ